MDRVRRILKIDDIHKNDILGRDVVTAIFDTGASEHADLSGKVLDFIENKQKTIITIYVNLNIES